MVLCLTALPFSAFGAESVEVKIPVSVKVSGGTPSSEESYTLVLRAADNAPMPEADTLKITGEGTGAFPAISYSAPGVYCYTVSQQSGSHKRGHYDETVFYVKVTVTNGESGDLEAVVAAHTDAEMTGEKQDIVFENSYDPIPTPTKEPAPTTEPTKEPEAGPTAAPETVQKETETTSTSAKAVKTGDETDMTLWIGMLIGAVCVFCAASAYVYSRKHSSHEE